MSEARECDMAEPDGTEENAGRKRVGSSMSMGQGKPYEFKGELHALTCWLRLELDMNSDLRF